MSDKEKRSFWDARAGMMHPLCWIIGGGSILVLYVFPKIFG